MCDANRLPRKSSKEPKTRSLAYLLSAIKRRAIAPVRSLLGASLIVGSISWAAAQTAPPTAVDRSGNSVKARLSNLIELNPDSFSTDIDLFGVEAPPDPLGLPMHTQAFQARGKIITLGKERNNGYNSNAYLVLTEANDVIEVQNTEIDGIPGSGGDESIERLIQVADDGEIIRGNLRSRFVSTRFFNGKLDGKVATLILLAQRSGDGPDALSSSPLGSSVKVMISLYELQSDEVEQPGHFVRVAHFVTSKSYCNADLALWQELAIPLPKVYGAQTIMC